jgi:hypothetical protein
MSREPSSRFVSSADCVVPLGKHLRPEVMVITEQKQVRVHLFAAPAAQTEDSFRVLRRVEGDIFESGNWTCSESTAARAIGAELHLHEAQDKPSWHCGVIIGWHPAANLPDRVVFRFKLDRSLARKQREYWARQKALVWA